ncbi:rod shape-determining protein MreD [Clostridium sediminicola]|uniref:rod shape-determining protein MreD n=1 Tax=Clostridium sediminicola TaxID=3114879 RepID=UPI0031F1D8A4
MKKITVVAMLGLVFFGLDNVFSPFLAVSDVYPSLLFSFSISYSIINGKWEALSIGIFSGVLQDTYFTNIFGINILSNMLMCILAAKIGELIYKHKVIVPIVINFLTSIIKGIIVVFLLFIVGQYTDNSLILYRGLYTGLVSFLMYKFVYYLSTKNFMEKKWNFKKRGY